MSDDNNKGKTILIQSMLYAIGNNPIFPDSFDYKNYYYYLKFEQNDKDYEIIRKGDSFIVQTDNVLHMLDGISELKRYWTKEIFDLPEFQFRGKQHLSDLELFIQLFLLVKMPKIRQIFSIPDTTIKMILKICYCLIRVYQLKYFI